MKIASINPYTGQVNQEFELLSLQQCHEAVAKSRRAFPAWKALSVTDRAALIRTAGQRLRENQRRLAQIVTMEMGKPIRESLAEIEKCAWLCDYYAENSEAPLEDDPIPTEAAKSYVSFEPLGTILGIMPWNFPFWQVFRFAVPAMAAGNVCLLKHASNVPITALEIEKIFADAKFPEGVFQTLLIDSKTAMKLVEEDKVDGVSLTGSVAAGSAIGELAGRRLKKAVLELGGSDPFIILEDADIDKAARTALQARTINTGQSCIAAKRFIVMESVVQEFQVKFLELFKSLKVGDPMDEKTDIGPLAKEEIVSELKRQLEDAKNKGANIIYGPEPPAGKGLFFQPAVVTNVNRDMQILKEEVFGPIAPILVVKNEAEAIELANSTEFGLGAAVWTRSIDRGMQLAKRIASGFVAVNDMVKSDPRLPFGGIKRSGFGRELSYYGLREFVNIKTVVVNE